MPESFTKNERLILANQYRILELIDEQEREAHKMAREILENGYVKEYADLTLGLSPEFPPEQAEEVGEIFAMHADLRYNYDRLENKEGINLDLLRFWGFDGNNESTYHRYAGSLHGWRKWDHLPGIEVNSHAPTLWRYRAMLAVWRTFPDRNALTRENIIAIINARPPGQ